MIFVLNIQDVPEETELKQSKQEEKDAINKKNIIQGKYSFIFILFIKYNIMKFFERAP